MADKTRMLAPPPSPGSIAVLAAASRTSQRLARAALAGLALAPAASRADDLGTMQDFDVRLDTTVRTDFAFRLASPSAALLSNINADDGDRAFAPGLISARTDLTTDLSAQRGDLGFDISADGWYDPVYFQPNANKSPSTFNAITVPHYEFPAATRDLMGADAELANAFVQDRFSLGGLPITIRLGRQTLLWGESLFFASNGVAAGQAPVDAIKSLGNPLAPARELYLPVTQITTRIELRQGLSLEAYDQFEWRRDRLPAADSYFSTTDILDAGSETILFPGYRLYRTADQTPHGIGQFGVALRSQSDIADLGLYAVQYDAKLPVPVFNPDAATYNLVFPRHIQLLGASFSTYAGESIVAGEFSVRHNMPLLASASTGPGAADIGGGGIYAAAELPPFPTAPPVANTAPYATGDIWLAQSSLAAQLRPGRWWQAASLQAEIAANNLIAVTSGHGAVLPGRTHFAAALRIVFTPQYFQILPGLDLSLPIGLGYTPVGRSSIDATMYQGAGDATISATATYRQVWQAALAFTHFIGGATAQHLADRDFVSLSLSRTF
jgi:hypothetical protein